MHGCWTTDDDQIVRTCGTLHDLADIAIIVLKRIRAKHPGMPIYQICGPMTTGGLGTRDKNMLVFNHMIDIAREHGLIVFDQSVFQEMMIIMIEGCVGYPLDILTVFYTRIFQSGLIDRTLYFPTWAESRGTNWERWTSYWLGILIEDIPPEWYQEALRRAGFA